AEELELFKKTIVDHIEQIKRKKEFNAKRKKQPEYINRVPTFSLVFVNHTPADEDFAKEICTVLDQHGFICAQPLFQGRPEDVRKDFEANLNECNGFILVYGKVTPMWIHEQLRNLIKHLALCPRQYHPWWLVDGPPSTKLSPVRITCPGMRMIVCRTGTVAEHLIPILTELKEGGQA